MRYLFLLTSILVFSACTTSRALPPSSIGGPDAEGRPGAVRVITKSGSDVIVRQPFVVADSLYGHAEEGPVSFATADLRAVRVSEVDDGRTVAAAYGGAVVVGYVVGAALASVMLLGVLLSTLEG